MNKIILSLVLMAFSSELAKAMLTSLPKINPVRNVLILRQPPQILRQIKEFALKTIQILSIPEELPYLQSAREICGRLFKCIKLSSSAEYEIFFPEEASQLTTAEVVLHSCANAEYSGEQDIITNWYLAMFGLIKHEGKYLQMGLDLKVKAQRIITMDRSMDEETQSTFIKNFRRIASVSVGRVLLYRLLIEIWRTDKEGEKNIIIKHGHKGNSFSAKQQTIKFLAQDPTQLTGVINKAAEGFFDFTELKNSNRPDDIGLFHEILHWFHFFRYKERFEQERKIDVGNSGSTDIVVIGDYSPNHWILENDITINDEEQRIRFVKLEEFRTILGYTEIVIGKSSEGKSVYIEKYDYLEGDDLSENLYRLCIGEPLRYGYTSENIEKTDAIKIVIEKCKAVANNGNYRVKNEAVSLGKL